tara:strand:+ start:1643 stop:2065 length:423 start_codon:yes stop_codon:yes gene_type:complete
MTDFTNKSTLNKMRKDIEAALRNIEGTYGCKFDLGNIGYNADGSGFKTKLVCDRLNSEGNVETQFAKDFVDNYWSMVHGLPTDILNKEINGITVIGFKSRARKNSILFEQNGKQFVSNPSYIKLKMGISEGCKQFFQSVG